MTDYRDEKLQNQIKDAFDMDELVVSEELIARTLEACKSVEQVSPDDETPVKPPVKTFSTRVTATYFGVFAAACLVIVAAVAVPMLMRPMGKSSSAPSSMKMTMNDMAPAAVEESAEAPASATAAPDMKEAPGSPMPPAAAAPMAPAAPAPSPDSENGSDEMFKTEGGVSAFGLEDEKEMSSAEPKVGMAIDSDSDRNTASAETAEKPHSVEVTGLAPAAEEEHEGINAVVDASSDAGDHFESRLKALIGKSCTKKSTARATDGSTPDADVLLKFKVIYADESYEIHSLWSDGVYTIVRRFPADNSFNEVDYITSDLDAFLNELVNMIN